MNGHTHHLPWNFGLFDWIASTKAESIEASKADDTKRPIGITAFIEDPRARTGHAWVSPPTLAEYHVNVEGETVNIWLHATPDRLLNSVTLGTFAHSAQEGLLRCAALLYSLLSTWSFQAQRPFGLRELAIEDKTHGAVWCVRPQAQVPLQLNSLTSSLGASAPIGSLLALFREGMTSVQPSYRFMCYYKIIEAWIKCIGPFAQINKLLSDRGKGSERKSLKVERSMFEGECLLDRYDRFIGKKFGWCFEQMNDARKFLAHPFSTEGVFVSLDDPQTLQALSDLANLAERMSIEILVEEIRLLQMIASPDISQKIAGAYVHESWGLRLLEKGG